LAGTLTIGSTNTLADGGFTLTVNGTTLPTITNGGIHSSTGTGEILLGGASAQSLSGAGTYGNVEIANTGGLSLTNSASSCTIAGTLTFTSGDLTMNTNTLTLSGTVTGTGGKFSGSTTSGLSVTGTSGTVGTLNFNGGAAQNLSTLTINRTGGANP